MLILVNLVDILTKHSLQSEINKYYNLYPAFSCRQVARIDLYLYLGQE